MVGFMLMGEFIPVLKTSELPTEGFKAVEANGRSVLISCFNHHAAAWLDRCPHAGAPLRIGKLRGTELKCAWHGWTFDLSTGECVPDNPAFKLTPIALKLEGDQVFVQLPETAH